MNQDRNIYAQHNSMVKTIPGRNCHRENVPADVGLVFQTHFHNNNLPNPQCLISRDCFMLMLIFEQGF